MRIRPQAWLDRFWQFAGMPADGRGPSGEPWPIPVAVWQDGRGTSSREAAPYAVFSVSAGNPTATQHWCYTYTPLVASKEQILRIVFLEANLETATTLIGVRIGTATAKAATNAVFPIGDGAVAISGNWTVDEIAAANVPLVLFNLFPSESLEHLGCRAAYPEYALELVIPPNQVAEFIAMTADDAFSMRAGFYTLPLT